LIFSFNDAVSTSEKSVILLCRLASKAVVRKAVFECDVYTADIKANSLRLFAMYLTI